MPTPQRAIDVYSCPLLDVAHEIVQEKPGRCSQNLRVMKSSYRDALVGGLHPSLTMVQSGCTASISGVIDGVNVEATGALSADGQVFTSLHARIYQ